MPFSLYETSIRVGDAVQLRPSAPYFKYFGELKGKAESVILNNLGYWEITVDYKISQIVVDSRELRSVAE